MSPTGKNFQILPNTRYNGYPVARKIPPDATAVVSSALSKLYTVGARVKTYNMNGIRKAPIEYQSTSLIFFRTVAPIRLVDREVLDFINKSKIIVNSCALKPSKTERTTNNTYQLVEQISIIIYCLVIIFMTSN